MIIDLSHIEKRERKVILCRSEAEVSILAQAVTSLYPDSGLSEDRALRAFKTHNKRDGLCYRIELTRDGSAYYGFDYEGYYVGQGYTVVDFTSLLIVEDLGNITFSFSDTNEAIAALL